MKSDFVVHSLKKSGAEKKRASNAEELKNFENTHPLPPTELSGIARQKLWYPLC